jgi:tetratricopeptide (TPR) repeat protein
MIYEILGRHQEAIEQYKNILELNPDHQKALFNLGWVLMDENRFMEAIPHLKHAIKLNPENTDAHFSLGLFFGRLNRYQDAQDQYNKVLQLDPNHSGAYERLTLTQKAMEIPTVSTEKEVFPKELDIILVP